MGRLDNRRKIKMRRRKSQAKYKLRLIRLAETRGKERTGKAVKRKTAKKS